MRQALARKTLEEGGQTDADRISYAFRRALSRQQPAMKNGIALLAAKAKKPHRRRLGERQ